MALRQYASMAHDDEQLYNLSKGMPADYDPPEYPGALCFYLSLADFERAGGKDANPNDMMRFSAMGETTSVMRGRETSRVELQICRFAGEDGKLFDLERPACICLCTPELERMHLGDDADIGDTIHLIGSVRVESLLSSEWGEQVQLQITELTYEDESEEAREG